MARGRFPSFLLNMSAVSSVNPDGWKTRPHPDFVSLQPPGLDTRHAFMPPVKRGTTERSTGVVREFVAEYPKVSKGSNSPSKSNSVDPCRFFTEKELTSLMHLPEGFRFRDARKALLNRCGLDQRNYIESCPVHAQILLRLPHRLTMRDYALCVLLVCFHSTALHGRPPNFWTDEVEDTIKEALVSDVESFNMYSIASGRRMYVRRSIERGSSFREVMLKEIGCLCHN